MRTLSAACLVLLLSLFAFSQTKSRAEFEVASIKPTVERPMGVDVGLHIDGAQIRTVYLSLKDYIGMAYKVKTYQIVGPEWLASQRFDIAAKLPDGSQTAQIPEMIQNLLIDRFKMKMHQEQKDFPVYTLEAVKGALKLTETPPDGTEDTPQRSVNVGVNAGPGGVGMDFGRGSYLNFRDNKFEGKKMTMQSLVDTLSRFVDRPVVDKTELKGNYDFVLELTPEDYQAMLIRSAVNAGVSLPPQAMRVLETASNDSLMNSLQKLGLKLESRKAPLDVLVIDSMEKMPTAN
jgi:uncharacterized protein (TIGR03435 family)